MIRINQIKLPVDHEPEAIKEKISKLLHTAPQNLSNIKIRRRSLDARKKPELYFSYVVDVTAVNEKRLVHKANHPQILLHRETEYHFPESGEERLHERPVIIGTGPAGLFCGYMLAKYGYEPLILERGEDVDTRRKKVDSFWSGGELDPQCNVQFGEGGAGTFSDGKLNTLVKDPAQRNHLVLETFHHFGADESILYDSKPHIGTDVLSGIVKNMREEIIRIGGEVRFASQMTKLCQEKGRISGIVVKDWKNGCEITIPTQVLVLAIGHSARDTFEMLSRADIPMAAKAFAVGLRIQHPQSMINDAQYGRECVRLLGPASYKVTAQTSFGRGVYSFCMCPGGYVVNASSEPGRLAINGMSYHDRAGVNANSALIVTVNPDDFADSSPLAGIAWQRRLEERAFQAGGGKIPLQLYRDFCQNRISTSMGGIRPEVRGAWTYGNLREVLPDELSAAFMEGMDVFGRKIRGFDRSDAVLAGIESRTSSPVRILRDERFESEWKGLYPCGEGAGYAGGITSAAMDGIRVAEAIASRYSPRLTDGAVR
ncbi:MAG: NAD(P)-binding protein [Clostridiales bacterium]|nr:NAD(P)-binding protein [Clostridiales bacterium]